MKTQITKEREHFIKRYGDPRYTMIPNWFKRLFLPSEYFLVRESVYADLKILEKNKTLSKMGDKK